MKQPKRLTCEQKRCLSAHSLNWKDWMFVCAETTNYWMIVYHKETKVMYAVNKNISNNAGCGVFSPLYNADGTLQIYEGDEIE